MSIDYDPAVVGSLWRKARAEEPDALPLVVNLTRPTPDTGWQNREWPSFLDRARGAFDAVFMLAVVHHVFVSERVPLMNIAEIASELTSDWLVVEFGAPDDPTFRLLARGGDELHAGLDPARFENTFERWFRLVEAQPLEGSVRRLYLMRRRTSPVKEW